MQNDHRKRLSIFKKCNILFLFSIFLMSISCHGNTQSSKLLVTVDNSQTQGRINPMDWGTYGFQPRGLTTGLFYVDMNRERMFPVSGDSDANPDDPGEYNLRFIDMRARQAIDNGVIPLVKIFPLPGAITRSGVPFSAARNPSQVQKVVGNVIRHISEGWNNGLNFPLKYVEIWNEPDFHGAFWRGSEEDLFKIYESAAEGIKAVDKNIAVGGLGFAWVDYTKPNSWITDFLDYCQRRNVPVDFLSWHQYDFIPGCYNDKAEKINEILSRYPDLSPLYGKPKSFNTEWNNIVGFAMRELASQFTPMDAAAHNISSIIQMMNAGVYAAYRIPQPPVWPESALETLFKMNDTPVRISATGTNSFGTATLAGKSNDGKKIQVLVSYYNTSRINMSNYRIPPPIYPIYTKLRERMVDLNQGNPEPSYSSIQINFKNIPWDSTQHCTLTHYILDEDKGLVKRDTKKFSNSNVVNFDCSCSSPSIHLFELEQD